MECRRDAVQALPERVIRRDNEKGWMSHALCTARGLEGILQFERVAYGECRGGYSALSMAGQGILHTIWGSQNSQRTPPTGRRPH